MGKGFLEWEECVWRYSYLMMVVRSIIEYHGDIFLRRKLVKEGKFEIPKIIRSWRVWFDDFSGLDLNVYFDLNVGRINITTFQQMNVFTKRLLLNVNLWTIRLQGRVPFFLFFPPS